MFQNVNVLLRTLVLAGLVGIAGWWTLFLKGKIDDRDAELVSARQEVTALSSAVEDKAREIERLGTTLEERDAAIADLEADVAEKARRIETLDLALRLLKVNTRVGKIEVLDQGPDPDAPDDSGHVRTSLRFTELGPNGEPVGAPRELTVAGKTVYLETLVVKFKDSYVEQGDSLRGTSICLFKRVFGEEQKPSEGVPLDPVGQQPLVYAGDETPSPLHRELWTRFWDYANDAELADQLGVRALHGEAPFIEARPGKTYWVELRSSSGLEIRSE